MDESPADTQLRVQREIAQHSQAKRIGNYEIVRKVGQGAFSSVFLAVHSLTRHEVVLKSAEKIQANLASEIANLKSLWHPHIAHLYEYIVMPDRVWLVLEYAGGDELLGWLVANRLTIPVNTAQKICAQLAGAVAYAHQRNCAHRDLKLENVLLDTEGNVKLGDFGFVRSYVPRAMLETVCGTEPYMAPELLLRKKYWPEATDVWSLGVIFYALLFGQLPFGDDSIVEITHRVVETEPKWDLPTQGEDSAGLVALVKKMLIKDPRMRPHARDLLKDPALGDWGAPQLALLSEKPPPPFSTRQEKRVLKALRVLNVDVHALAMSVIHHDCDPLHGLWFTALDYQKRHNNQRPHKSTRSARSLSLRSVRSVRSIRSTRSFARHGTESAGESGEEPPPMPDPPQSSPSPLPIPATQSSVPPEKTEHTDRKEKPLEKLWSALTRRTKKGPRVLEVTPPLAVTSLVSTPEPSRRSERSRRPMSTYSQLSQLSQLSETSGSESISLQPRSPVLASGGNRFRAQRQPAPQESRLQTLRERFSGLIEEE